MSERAKRAAEELERRGWMLFEDTNLNCVACGKTLARSARYCHQCGYKVGPASVTLEDLEAAIVAALKE